MHQDLQIMLGKIILVVPVHIFFRKIKVMEEDHLIEVQK